VTSGGAEAAPRDVRDDDGRLDPDAGAKHGVLAPRGLTAAPGSRGGRFTRMFPFLPRHDPGRPAIEALAERMFEARHDETNNDDVPAGFTYLAQFIDHDVTYDATSKIDRDNDPDALANFRTPRLDLDSLYGSGPADQPFLYDWDRGACRGVKLLIGDYAADGESATVDLPRNRQGRATIPDPRNDENLIISQLHLLLMKFHNRVVQKRHDDDGLVGNALFDAAYQDVRWHYQWVVMRDFLPTILGTHAGALLGPLAGLTDVAAGDEPVTYGWKGAPAIPVEFSAAAYRFGHSMVRRSYPIGDPDLIAPLILHSDSERDRRHLGGFRRLPKSLQIDWTKLFGPAADVPGLVIDEHLAFPLFELPADHASLPELNLERGRFLGLPSGRDVARAMGRVALTDDELLPQDFWPTNVKPVERGRILAAPPLWFYVLREAAVDSEGRHLGPVGGRIVAEVLVGLLEADDSSYLHNQVRWEPTLIEGDFKMIDLVGFALGDG
jgi:hypothetical protein